MPHNPHFVDIVGTGGDGAHTFNISTAAAFVAAAAGATVAKHGNRSVSSQVRQRRRAGGARRQDRPAAPSRWPSASRPIGIGFMFAPNHHPAMKHVAPVRKEMGVRTIFNILGPLTNPAGAPNQLMGVFHPDLVGIQVRVMQRLGADHVLVVYVVRTISSLSLIMAFHPFYRTLHELIAFSIPNWGISFNLSIFKKNYLSSPWSNPQNKNDTFCLPFVKLSLSAQLFLLFH